MYTILSCLVPPNFNLVSSSSSWWFPLLLEPLEACRVARDGCFTINDSKKQNRKDQTKEEQEGGTLEGSNEREREVEREVSWKKSWSNGRRWEGRDIRSILSPSKEHDISPSPCHRFSSGSSPSFFLNFYFWNFHKQITTSPLIAFSSLLSLARRQQQNKRNGPLRAHHFTTVTSIQVGESSLHEF